MLSYAYVYVHGAAHPEWRGAGQWPSDWAWFVDFLTTHQGRDEMAPGLTLARFFTGEFPALIWGELTWVVLVGGLVGLWWLGRRRALFIVQHPGDLCRLLLGGSLRQLVPGDHAGLSAGYSGVCRRAVSDRR